MLREGEGLEGVCGDRGRGWSVCGGKEVLECVWRVGGAVVCVEGGRCCSVCGGWEVL